MKKFRFMTMLAILALTLWAMVMPAQAITAIDFNIDATAGNNGGSINYFTLGGALVGSQIEVDTVGDPDGSVPSLAITHGSFSFTTGNLTSTTDTTWVFGGGGTILITGDVDFGSGLKTGVELLSGTMESATVTAAGGTFKVAVATFFDTKDERLLTYFGIDPAAFTGPFSGNFNISFLASGIPPNTFASTKVLSGDVVNFVPIPPTAMLFGGGLFGLVALGWRRRKKT